MEAPDWGVVYLGFGAPHIAMSVLSARTLRRTNPHVPIAVLTNAREFDSEILARMVEGPVQVIGLDVPSAQNREVKVSLNDYSPFSKTVFLDSDTIVRAPIDDLAEFLDYFDVCVRPYVAGTPHHSKASLPTLDGCSQIGDLPHFNSGVFAFAGDRPQVRDFFDTWSSSYHAMNSPYDQPSLVEAVYRSRVRILALDARWNAVDTQEQRSNFTTMKVLHYTRSSTAMDRAIRSVAAELADVLPNAYEVIDGFLSRRARYRRTALLKRPIRRAFDSGWSSWRHPHNRVLDELD